MAWSSKYTNPGTCNRGSPLKRGPFWKERFVCLPVPVPFFRTKAVSFREIQGKWPGSGKGKIHGTYTPQVSLVHRKNGVARNHQLGSIYQPPMAFVKLFLQKLHHQQIWKKRHPGQWTTGSLRYEFAFEKWVLCSVKDENLGCTKVQKFSDFFPTFCTTR